METLECGFSEIRVSDFTYVFELIQIPTGRIGGHCWHDQAADLDSVYAVAPQMTTVLGALVRIALNRTLAGVSR